LLQPFSLPATDGGGGGALRRRRVDGVDQQQGRALDQRPAAGGAGGGAARARVVRRRRPRRRGVSGVGEVRACATWAWLGRGRRRAGRRRAQAPLLARRCCSLPRAEASASS